MTCNSARTCTLLHDPINTLFAAPKKETPKFRVLYKLFEEENSSVNWIFELAVMLYVAGNLHAFTI